MTPVTVKHIYIRPFITEMPLIMYFTSGIITFGLLVNVCIGKRNWDYEPLSATAHTSDPTKMDLKADLVRVARDYAVTVVMNLQYDIDEKTMIEALSYRSSSGNQYDYVPLPWSVPKTTFDKFVTNFYEELIYKNLANCSNLPETAQAYHMEKKVYEFKLCTITGSGLPEIMSDGYYKICLMLTGEVDWGLDFVIKVTTNRNLIG